MIQHAFLHSFLLENKRKIKKTKTKTEFSFQSRERRSLKKGVSRVKSKAPDGEASEGVHSVLGRNEV